MAADPKVTTPAVGVVVGQVVIAAEPAAVWDYVTDWERQGEWIPATTVRVTGDRQIIARTGLSPFGLTTIGFTDVMHVVRSEPPRLCEVAHTGRIVSGTGVFTCEPAGDGATLFAWEEHVRVPGGPAAGILWRAAAPAIRAGYRVALARLRDRLAG